MGQVVGLREFCDYSSIDAVRVCSTFFSIHITSAKKDADAPVQKLGGSYN